MSINCPFFPIPRTSVFCFEMEADSTLRIVIPLPKLSLFTRYFSRAKITALCLCRVLFKNCWHSTLVAPLKSHKLFLGPRMLKDISDIQWELRKEKVPEKEHSIDCCHCSGPCSLCLSPQPVDWSQPTGFGVCPTHPSWCSFLARVKHTDTEVRWPWEGRRAGWRAI